MTTWLGSPNFTAGRQGHSLSVAPAYVVVHTMVGTVSSANDRFQDPNQQASAHYGVGLDGSVVQWVQEQDTAWHAGVWDVNLDSIGIEHEDNGNYNAPRTDALYAASAALVRDICHRYSIPIVHSSIGASGIIAHREDGYATSCPDSLDVDRIIRQAAEGAPQPVVPKEIDMVIARDTSSNAEYVVGVEGKRYIGPEESALLLAANVPFKDTDSATLSSIPTVSSLRLARDPVSGAIYIVGESGKRHIDPPEWDVLQKLGLVSVDVSATEIASIPDAPHA